MNSVIKNLIDRPILWLLVIGIPVFLTNYFVGNPGISGWDANFYYSYAGAIVENGSLDLESAYKELVAHGADPSVFDISKRTPSGRIYNYFPIGHPLFHTPALLAGSCLSRFIEKKPGAFSVTAQLFYCLSCIGAAAVGLWLMHRQLVRIFDPEAAAVSLYVMAGTTMLCYYWFVLPALSHTSSLLMVGLIVTIFMALNNASSKRTLFCFLLGLTIGINTMVRLQDIGFVFFAFVALCWIIADHSPMKDKLLCSISIAIGGAVGFLPQLLHWRWRDGSWYVAQYSDYAYFSWTKPHLLEVLFSPRHGLFFWHPFFLVAAVSFLIFLRKMRGNRNSFRLSLSLLLAFFSTYYIGASLSIWWFGDSFGSRPFLSLAPLFLIGISYLWTKMRRNKTQAIAFWAIAGLLSLWNALLAVSFHLGWISRSEALDFGALLRKLSGV